MRSFLSCFAWVLPVQGKYVEAALLYRRTMAITEATLGRDHAQYSNDLNNLAMLLEEQVRARVWR